jgi:hypothetical protein
MTPKKEYLINLFLKVSKHNKLMKSLLDYNFNLLRSDYSDISSEDFLKISQKYDIKEYNKRVLLTIDNYFTNEDLNNIIKFFLSPSGQKISDSSFVFNLEKIIKKMINEATEQCNNNGKEKK